jgi:hypothetical protein
MSDIQPNFAVASLRDNDVERPRVSKKAWSRPRAIESAISNTAHANGGGGDGGGFPSSSS